MSYDHDLEGKFLAALGEVDEERARRVQLERCPHCGGPLDRADFPRKPRGELGEARAVRDASGPSDAEDPDADLPF